MTETRNFGGVNYNDLYLVRVQNSLSSEKFENGKLVLNRAGSGRADTMNTFHFTINAAVENHAMGTQFNSANCVIIAPMLKTVNEGQNIPDGFLPADTYFQADAKNEMRLPGARLLAPDDEKIPAEFEALTQRYKRGNTPAETLSNRNEAIRKVFEVSLKAPFFTVGHDDWAGHSDMHKYEQFARDLAHGHEVSIGRHMNSSSDSWARLTGQTLSYLDDYKNGQRLHQDDTGMESRLWYKIQDAPKAMADFIADRKANNADPKAIGFYVRQYDQIIEKLNEARTIHEYEMSILRAQDKATQTANTPPPLPQMQPPPLPTQLSGITRTYEMADENPSASSVNTKPELPPILRR